MRQHKLILVSLGGLLAFHATAQNDDNYSDPYYEFVEDQPDFARFMGQIAIGGETDFSFRSEVPVGIYLHYDLKKIPLEFDAGGIISLLSERQRTIYPENLSDNEFQRYSTVQGGITFNFIDHYVKKFVKVTYKVKAFYTGSIGNETLSSNSYSVWREGLVRKRLGIRGGVMRYAQSITDYDSDGQSIVFPDGTTFPDADNPWDEKPTTGDNYYFTAERHLSGYIGLQFHRSTGLELDFKGYGVKDAKINFFLYADMLFNLASDIEKLSFEGQLYDLNDATSGVSLNNLGFRAGVKRLRRNVFYSIEFGMRPQYFEADIYTQILVGYSFNGNF